MCVFTDARRSLAKAKEYLYTRVYLPIALFLLASSMTTPSVANKIRNLANLFLFATHTCKRDLWNALMCVRRSFFDAGFRTMFGGQFHDDDDGGDERELNSR
jgi:hypothetical protein